MESGQAPGWLPVAPRSMPACVKMNEVRLAAVNRCLSCFLPAQLLGPHLIFKYLKGRPFPLKAAPSSAKPRLSSFSPLATLRAWWVRSCCSAKYSGSFCSMLKKKYNNNTHAHTHSLCTSAAYDFRKKTQRNLDSQRLM